MKYIQRVGFVFHSRHAKCLFIKKERKKKLKKSYSKSEVVVCNCTSCPLLYQELFFQSPHNTYFFFLRMLCLRKISKEPSGINFFWRGSRL